MRADLFFYDDLNYKLSCHGKKKYDSEWQAQFAADECFEKSRGKTVLHFYLCKYCNKFHLTSRRY